jgi:hypothetical protein
LFKLCCSYLSLKTCQVKVPYCWCRCCIIHNSERH